MGITRPCHTKNCHTCHTSLQLRRSGAGAPDALARCRHTVLLEVSPSVAAAGGLAKQKRVPMSIDRLLVAALVFRQTHWQNESSCFLGGEFLCRERWRYHTLVEYGFPVHLASLQEKTMMLMFFPYHKLQKLEPTFAQQDLVSKQKHQTNNEVIFFVRRVQRLPPNCTSQRPANALASPGLG